MGFNSGAAAGQTIEHFHIHVIPRYAGDVADPRGGIRHVIPGQGNYLDPLLDPAADGGSPQLLDGSSEGQRLRSELARCLGDQYFDRIDLVVSFIQTSGLDIILPKLRDAIDRGSAVRGPNNRLHGHHRPGRAVGPLGLGRRVARGSRTAGSQALDGLRTELSSEGLPLPQLSLGDFAGLCWFFEPLKVWDRWWRGMESGYESGSAIGGFLRDPVE